MAAPRVAVLATVSLGSFLLSFSTSMANIALPSLQRDLAVSAPVAAWVQTSYLVVVTALLLGAGRVGDRVGTRLSFSVGAAVFGVGATCAALSPTFPLLLASRAVSGVGAAAAMSAGPAILVATYPPAERGRALGAQAMLTYVGLSLGPTLGGYLTSLAGWRGVFWTTAAVALALAVLAPVLLPVSPRRDVRVDLGPALAIGVVSASVVFGLHRSATRGGVDALAAASLATGVLVAVLIALRESRASVPFIPRALASSFEIRRGVAAAIAQYASTFSLGFATPFFLQHAFGKTPREAGLLMTVQPVAMVLSSPVAGVLADRASPRPVALTGLAAIAVGGGLLSIASSTIGFVLVGLCLVGVGSGLFTTPNTALALGAAEPQSRTTASSILAWARNVGMAIGVATAALVFALTGGTDAAFSGCALACAAFATAGAALYLAR